MTPLRIYLCGQGSFGRAALDLLLEEGHTVVGVSSPPQRDGRPDRLAMGAHARRLPWLPAGHLNAGLLPDDTDLIVCAHSHDFIGRATRLRARLGAVGYHPSLLPVHRGRDAVRWTIRMGDRVTGGSVYWLTDSVDAGPLAAQRHVLVPPGIDASELWRTELFPLGVSLLRKVLRDLAGGVVVRVPQDERCATWEPSIGRAPLRRPDLIMLPEHAGRGDAYVVDGDTHTIL